MNPRTHAVVPRSATSLVFAAAVLILGALAVLALRTRPPTARIALATEPSRATTPPPPATPEPGAALDSTAAARDRRGGAVPSAASATASSPADEVSLMATLRALRGSDPERTLTMAREGNRRFPNGPDTAERSWFIVKSLSDLGRHEQARAEGRILLERFRGTPWAEDVYRHLFVNPPTHPFERGYGKRLESDTP